MFKVARRHIFWDRDNKCTNVTNIFFILKCLCTRICHRKCRRLPSLFSVAWPCKEGFYKKHKRRILYKNKHFSNYFFSLKITISLRITKFLKTNLHDDYWPEFDLTKNCFIWKNCIISRRINVDYKYKVTFTQLNRHASFYK